MFSCYLGKSVASSMVIVEEQEAPSLQLISRAPLPKLATNCIPTLS